MGALLFENKKQKTERCIIPWEKAGIHIPDKEISIKTDKIKIMADKLRTLLRMDWRKAAAGLLFGVACVLLVNRFTSYPDGYVVYRTDCSGIPQERNYYDVNNPEYLFYRRMHPFEQGEEIEYFGGNIVVMERVRDNIAGLVLGYTAGYALAGIWITHRSKERVSNEK